MKKIESVQNIKIKQIQRLKKNHERKKTGLFIIEGKEELRKALLSKINLEYIFLSLDILKEIPDFLKEKQDQIFLVSEEIFKKISYRENSEGVLAVAKRQELKLKDIELKENALILILESLEKPGNLGAILRTADAGGIDALIICDSHTDIYNPNVIRASIGAVFNLPLVLSKKEEVFLWLKKNKIKSFATSPRAKINYTQENFKDSLALIIGTEHEGLSEDCLRRADKQIKIPMFGKSDSLNASVSTAIIVYEIIRQRDKNIV